ICSGNCITLKSNITGKYFWSTGDTTASIRVCPTNSTVITLKVISGLSTYYNSLKITIDKYGVFPGDADNNGVVNGNDVLNVGLAYGNKGPSRANANIAWNAQHANDWSKKFKHEDNYKYADC